MPDQVPILEFRGVSKQFSGNFVLKNVSFTLNPGEILGLVGENGAGKSTLMKILFGMAEIVQTGGFDGEILLEGRRTVFRNPFDALAAGIGMVHQEFSLIPGFTSSENILLNTEITKRSVLFQTIGKRLQTLDRASMRRRAQNAIDKLGVDLSPDTLVSELPVGHKQFIEIAREISRERVKLLVFDEPTAVLTESEAQIFITALRSLASSGIAIIFISHRLQEIIDVCDKVAVLRDGELVARRPIADVTLQEIALLMVGRDLAVHAREGQSSTSVSSEPVLKVQNLWVDMPGEYVKDVSFSVNRGEIFGIGGLAGQGKLGIPNGIMSLMPSGGDVIFEDKRIAFGNPAEPLKRGLAFVSEDRRGVGLLLDEPIDWNITFSAMQVQGRYLHKLLGGLVKVRDEKAMRKAARGYIETLAIRCTGERQFTRQLSGGNQQKVCLAKAFALEPRLLFVSEPTRGIDVGAKALVLSALRSFSEQNGTTIVIVSSELEELRSICDRIAIITEGVVAGILPYDANALEFGLLMSGSKQAQGANRAPSSPAGGDDA